MDHHIEPSPVITMDDLLAKVDLLSGGIHQYQSDRDPELLRAINRGAQELLNVDTSAIKGTRSQWKQATQKMARMKELMRQLKSEQSPVR